MKSVPAASVFSSKRAFDRFDATRDGINGNDTAHQQHVPRAAATPNAQHARRQATEGRSHHPEGGSSDRRLSSLALGAWHASASAQQLEDCFEGCEPASADQEGAQHGGGDAAEEAAHPRVTPQLRQGKASGAHCRQHAAHAARGHTPALDAALARHAPLLLRLWCAGAAAWPAAPASAPARCS